MNGNYYRFSLCYYYLFNFPSNPQPPKKKEFEFKRIMLEKNRISNDNLSILTSLHRRIVNGVVILYTKVQLSNKVSTRKLNNIVNDFEVEINSYYTYRVTGIQYGDDLIISIKLFLHAEFLTRVLLCSVI